MWQRPENMRGKAWKTAGLVAFMTQALALPGFACTSDEMARTDAGFIRKVVAGSNKIDAYADTSDTTPVFTLELLKPYFVICETDDYLRVSDLEAITVSEAETGLTGYVRKDQIYDWPTREGLAFSDLAFLGGRPEVAAWDAEENLRAFMQTGDEATNPPTFRENINATLRRDKGSRPYPVLASGEGMLLGRTPRRTFEVLLPAAIRPSDAVVLAEGDMERITRTLTSATIVIAFDATGSMESFATAVAGTLKSALGRLPPETLESLRIGFVFYRDVEDSIPLEALPPISLDEATRVLEIAAKTMAGGGDDAEPVLDAVQYAAQLYDWPEDSGKKIIVAVLNDDAKAATVGHIDPEDRIPAGIDAIGIARSLFELGIPVITVQAGPKRGQQLESVLGTLARETAGTFVSWDEGLDESAIATAFSQVLEDRTRKEIDAGRAIVDQVYELDGVPAIPLEVIDGEKLQRLREAGVAFNIDVGENGILVQQGFVMETPDLLEPHFQIDKATLLELINLMSVLAVTGVDSESLRRSVSQSLAAIAGEDVDPNETIAQTLQRQLGIQFRSGLLEFNLEFLDALTPTERVGFAKRLQQAAQGFDQFLNANLEELDRNPSIWMPVSALP